MGREYLQRIGLGVPDVLAAVRSAAHARHGVRRNASRAHRAPRRDHQSLPGQCRVRAGAQRRACVMQRRSMEQAIAPFGMDTITLAGPLEAKLDAIQDAGFTQVMLKANDLAGHPQGWQAAVKAVRSSGLRGTGFQVLRDFEGLSGHLHQYKVDIAKTMLEMCARSGLRGDARVLVDVDARHGGSRRHRARPAQARDARGAVRHPRGVRGVVVGPRRQRIHDGMGCRVSGRLSESRAWPRLLSTCWPRTPGSMPSTSSSRRGFSWSSCRTSCGRKPARSRSASPPRVRIACFPARACTAQQLVEIVLKLDALGYRRRLQLRGLQRRLRPAAVADGRRACAGVGALAGRGRAAPRRAASEPAAVAAVAEIRSARSRRGPRPACGRYPTGRH